MTFIWFLFLFHVTNSPVISHSATPLFIKSFFPLHLLTCNLKFSSILHSCLFQTCLFWTLAACFLEPGTPACHLSDLFPGGLISTFWPCLNNELNSPCVFVCLLVMVSFLVQICQCQRNIHHLMTEQKSLQNSLLLRTTIKRLLKCSILLLMFPLMF